MLDHSGGWAGDVIRCEYITVQGDGSADQIINLKAKSKEIPSNF